MINYNEQNIKCQEVGFENSLHLNELAKLSKQSVPQLLPVKGTCLFWKEQLFLVSCSEMCRCDIVVQLCHCVLLLPYDYLKEKKKIYAE